MDGQKQQGHHANPHHYDTHREQYVASVTAAAQQAGADPVARAWAVLSQTAVNSLKAVDGPLADASADDLRAFARKSAEHILESREAFETLIRG